MFPRLGPPMVVLIIGVTTRRSFICVLFIRCCVFVVLLVLVLRQTAVAQITRQVVRPVQTCG